MSEHYGCSDGGCIFGHPGGMHTNGGCHCVPTLSWTPEQRSRLTSAVCAVPPACELRRNEDGTLDELVARHPETIALEQLGEGLWQLRVFLPDKQAVYVELHTRGRAHIKATVLENP